jgi:TetR/AcrR family transcriptional regulator, mexJK operon transcriptional repressor
MEPSADTTAAPSRGKGRPRLHEAAEIDQAIQAAALQVILEQGEAATLNAVAHAAGLSRKTVYARYGNRVDLFTEVIRKMLVGAGRIDFDESGTLDDRLYSFVLSALRLVDTPRARALQRLLSVDPAYLASLREDLRGAIHSLFHAPLIELIETARADGAVAVDDPAQIAGFVMTLVFSSHGDPLGGDRPDGADHERTARVITNLFLQGISSRK